jgi:hypothetical protein
MCKIWGFHGGDYEECRRLRCGVCSHLLTLVARSRTFLPWKWRRYVLPKRRFTQDLHIPEDDILQDKMYFSIYWLWELKLGHETDLFCKEQMLNTALTVCVVSSALASAMMLGPRLGRYDMGNEPLPLGSPVNAVMGLFVLWWGWLAFNSGR